MLVCCKCGSSLVSCGAIVNPNTGEVFDYEENAFNEAFCDDCSESTHIINPDETKGKIRKLYDDFKQLHEKEPTIAFADVYFRLLDETHMSKIYIARDVDNHEYVSFSVKNIDELYTLCEPEEEKVILHFNFFSNEYTK